MVTADARDFPTVEGEDDARTLANAMGNPDWVPNSFASFNITVDHPPQTTDRFVLCRRALAVSDREVAPNHERLDELVERRPRIRPIGTSRWRYQPGPQSGTPSSEHGHSLIPCRRSRSRFFIASERACSPMKTASAYAVTVPAPILFS
jgi:hypothetical protein